MQHNIEWACGSVILIYIYYNTILCEHVEVLFQYWFITTQCCVSTSKCYFNIHLLQHNIVWACGSVILIYIYYNTILCEHVDDTCGSVILIYIYYNTILCEHVGSVILIYIYYNTIWAVWTCVRSVILIYIYYNTILCEHVEVLF